MPVLLFDEADALFNKRTSVNDAHDKFINHEDSYLLQKVENYNSVILISLNDKKVKSEGIGNEFFREIQFPIERNIQNLWGFLKD